MNKLFGTGDLYFRDVIGSAWILQEIDRLKLLKLILPLASGIIPDTDTIRNIEFSDNKLTGLLYRKAEMESGILILDLVESKIVRQFSFTHYATVASDTENPMHPYQFRCRDRRHFEFLEIQAENNRIIWQFDSESHERNRSRSTAEAFHSSMLNLLRSLSASEYKKIFSSLLQEYHMNQAELSKISITDDLFFIARADLYGGYYSELSLRYIMEGHFEKKFFLVFDLAENRILKRINIHDLSYESRPERIDEENIWFKGMKDVPEEFKENNASLEVTYDGDKGLFYLEGANAYKRELFFAARSWN